MEKEAVNHPLHYNTGNLETIEIIEEITLGYGNGFIAFCLGNALKYIARAPFKHDHPTEDLRKASVYLNLAIKHLERGGK